MIAAIALAVSCATNPIGTPTSAPGVHAVARQPDRARAGAQRNIELGEVSLMQFRILVTAERSADAGRRSGRHVLRGTSPSALLVALQDSRFVGVATAAVGPVSMAMPGMQGMHGARPRVAPYVSGDSVITRSSGPALTHAKRVSALINLTAPLNSVPSYCLAPSDLERSGRAGP